MTTLFFLLDKHKQTLDKNFKLLVDKVCGQTLTWRIDGNLELYSVIKMTRKQFYGITFCDTYLHGIDKQLDDLNIWNYSSKRRFNYATIS